MVGRSQMYRNKSSLKSQLKQTIQNHKVWRLPKMILLYSKVLCPDGRWIYHAYRQLPQLYLEGTRLFIEEASM